MNWLRYGKMRRLLVKIACALPRESWMRERLNDFLYPDDAPITFRGLL